MSVRSAWVGVGVLLMLGACNSGPPSEATLQMRAERECRDKPFPEHTPIFKYCVDQELEKYRRSANTKRVYDSTIRNVPTTSSP